MDSSSQFEGNQIHVQSQEVYKKPKKQMNYEASANSGPWDEDQNLKYVTFIDVNRQNLTSRSKRRVKKIFKEMAAFIGTRNAIQSRSHHQKQLDKHKNISKIIEVMKKSVVYKYEDKQCQPLMEVSSKTTKGDQIQERVQNQNQNHSNVIVESHANIGQIQPKAVSTNPFDGNNEFSMVYYEFWHILGMPFYQNPNTFLPTSNGLWPIQFYPNLK